MSLDTLLEAAKYLEQMEQHQRLQVHDPPVATPQTATATTTVATTSNSSPSQSPTLQSQITSHIAPLNQQTLLIASHLTGSATQGMLHNQAESTSTSLLNKKVETLNRTRFLHNSFDIINPLYIDKQSYIPKRKPPPLAFRAGTREVHNKLEKHRRAHLKECFDILKKQLPTAPDEKKTSNLNILHSAIRYIVILQKKEKDLELKMEQLSREKIALQNKLALRKKDVAGKNPHLDISKILTECLSVQPECHQIMEVDNEDLKPRFADEATALVTNNGLKRLTMPILPSKSQISVPATTVTPNTLKEVTSAPVQTALSVLPVGYPLNQGLVLQKLAIVPKGGLTELTPLVPTFITQQQLNGKVVPLVNAQYVVGKCPLVVVSTANPRPS